MSNADMHENYCEAIGQCICDLMQSLEDTVKDLNYLDPDMTRRALLNELKKLEEK